MPNFKIKFGISTRTPCILTHFVELEGKREKRERQFYSETWPVAIFFEEFEASRRITCILTRTLRN